jgi:hypothetical protein
MSTLTIAASRSIFRSRRIYRLRRRWMILGLAGLTGVTLLMPSCTAPVHAQATKMKQKFKFVGGTVKDKFGKEKKVDKANDFHLETSLFIQRQPLPKSDVFKKVTVPMASKDADFEDGNMKVNDVHEVEWTASGKKSEVVDHFFTLDGDTIKDSSKLAALTNDFDFNPFGGGTVVTLATYNDSGQSLAGSYALYAKPIADFEVDGWDDLGDARLLQSLTSYSLNDGDTMPLSNFSLLQDEYILVVGTADDGDSTSIGPATFKTAFSARIPEPGTLSLLALGVLGVGLRRRRRLAIA